MNKTLRGGIAGLFILAATAGIHAQETAETTESQNAAETGDDQALKLPEDLAVTETEKYSMQEQRVGNRLDRVTVRWNNGITEVYQNERDDTIWFAEEENLGDQPNVRKWRIGSW